MSTTELAQIDMNPGIGQDQKDSSNAHFVSFDSSTGFDLIRQQQESKEDDTEIPSSPKKH